MSNPHVHDSPKALNRIEVVRVGLQEVQFHATLSTFNPWLKYLGMLVTCIVEYDVNHTHRGLGILNLFQNLPSGYSIYLFDLNKDELKSFEIICVHNVDPLATRCGFYRRLLILLEPTMSRTALILGGHSVRKQDCLIVTQLLSQCLVPVYKILLCIFISLR